VSFPEQTETLKTAERLKIMGITLTLNLFAFEFAGLNPLRLKVYDTSFVKYFLVSDHYCWELNSLMTNGGKYGILYESNVN
jgi:hypothetical protein